MRHHADDFATVLSLVAAGLGVALVPQLGAAQPPDGVQLVPLSVRRRTRIAYRRGGEAHPAVAAFCAAARDAARQYLVGCGISGDPTPPRRGRAAPPAARPRG